MSLATPRKGYKSVKLLPKHIIINIPEEWDAEVVKNILIEKIQNGINVKLENYGTGFPIFEIESLYKSDLIIEQSNLRLVSIENIKNYEQYKLKENDFLLNRVSKVKEGVGKCLIVQKPIENLLYEGNMIRIRIDQNRIYPMFLAFLMKSTLFFNYIQSTCKTTSLTSIDQGIIEKIPIILPPLPEQQKIATILSNVDNLIESTKQVITNSKKVKKGLMQKLLTRGIGHVTFKKVPWFFGKEIEIPEEWEVLPLSEVCSIRKTNSVKSNLYIGLEHINQNDNKLVGQSTTEEFTSNTNSFYNDDILYGKLRPLLNKVWLATEEGYCSTDILPLQTKENIVPTILLLILTDYRFFWFAVSYSSGTKMPRTNWSDMKNFLVFLPSVTEQQKITSILSNMDSKITSQEQYKEKLQKLKKSLMQKLLTGEVRV
jgi:type I restriction enzyme, S subunit